MATYYVDSNAAGGGTGADWANAYTTLTAAFSGHAAGDVYYVSHAHAESTAGAVTLASNGTAAAPVRVICVNSAGTVPPVSADLRTTATVTTTGANILAVAGAGTYYEGITFSSGSGAVTTVLNICNGAGQYGYFKNCKFVKAGTNASASAITCGILNGSSLVILDNVTMEVGSTSDSIVLRGKTIWRNTASALVARNVNAISMGEARLVLLEGVDLSPFVTGLNVASGPAIATLKDCKLNASTSFTVPTIVGAQLNLIRADSGDTNYRTESYQYQGTLTTETTTVRTGGASDGTTTIAWKVVPTANNERDFPFECFPISIWNETVGSAVTLTIEGYWGGGAVPTTADIWMDVECLGTSGFPLGTFTSGGIADSLAAGTNHAASTETWGAGGTTKFKMAVSVTPQEKGPITVYIKYANVTNTVWIDPLITVS